MLKLQTIRGQAKKTAGRQAYFSLHYLSMSTFTLMVPWWAHHAIYPFGSFYEDTIFGSAFNKGPFIPVPLKLEDKSDTTSSRKCSIWNVVVRLYRAVWSILGYLSLKGFLLQTPPGRYVRAWFVEIAMGRKFFSILSFRTTNLTWPRSVFSSQSSNVK